MSEKDIQRPIIICVDWKPHSLDELGINVNQLQESGVEPVFVAVSAAELGWSSRETMLDEYTPYMVNVIEKFLRDQGVDLDELEPWLDNVRIVVLNRVTIIRSLPPIQDLFMGLFPEARFFGIDRRGRIIQLWEDSQSFPSRDVLLAKPVSTLDGLDGFTLNRLSEAQVDTVGDLVRLSSAEVRKIDGIGSKRFEWIVEALKGVGLALRDDN